MELSLRCFVVVYIVIWLVFVRLSVVYLKFFAVWAEKEEAFILAEVLDLFVERIVALGAVDSVLYQVLSRVNLFVILFEIFVVFFLGLLQIFNVIDPMRLLTSLKLLFEQGHSSYSSHLFL